MVSRSRLTQMKLPLLVTLLATTAIGQQDPDAASLLQLISRGYSQAKQYHIEARLSEDLRSELSGDWTNSTQAAIVAENGQYRFEVRGPHYSWVQISNGRTEWIYDATTQEYAQKNTSKGQKPSHFGDAWSYEQEQLIDAQDIPGHMAEEIGSVRNPKLVRSELLSIGNSNIDCFVIQGQGKYKSGWSPDTNVELTFWIEKKSKYVRKLQELWRGQLIRGDISYYTRANVEVYPVVDLESPAAPPNLFQFQAPPAAKLVANFERTHTLPTPQRSSLVGMMAPELTFRSADGHVVLLSSIRGKPTLIEFWATWCGSCIDAFAKLEQLYSQATRRGIVVITVDEDEQPAKADAFLATHRRSSWPNYHDDGEINRSLPGDGLPQFVLIDVAGKIVYAKSGFDEHELRAALGHLVPGYMPLDNTPK